MDKKDKVILPTDDNCCRVNFKNGDFIESQWLSIEFARRSITLTTICNFKLKSKYDREVIKKHDTIYLLIEARDIESITCDSGEIKLPFLKKELEKVSK
jgi:hypothetical protein